MPLTERQKIVIDELTPIFVAMMEEFPVQQRKVLAVVASLNKIVTAKEVAAAGRLQVNTASAVLGRLVKKEVLVDYTVNPRLKQYDFSYKHEWLARWLRVRRTGDDK